MRTLPSGDARNFKRSRSDASDAWAANAASAVYFYKWKKSRQKTDTDKISDVMDSNEIMRKKHTKFCVVYFEVTWNDGF